MTGASGPSSPRAVAPDDGGAPAGTPARILVVTPWWPADEDDAAGSFVRDGCLALLAHGADVRVAVVRLRKPTDGGERVATSGRGATRAPRLLCAPWLPYGAAYDALVRTWTSLVRRAWRGARPFVRGATVVVHTQELAVPACRALRGTGARYVVVAHGLEPDSPRYRTPRRRAAYRRALEEAARTIAVGPSLARALRAEAPRADVRVVGNGFDEARVARAGAEAGEEREPRLVSVATLTEEKGIGLVLRALGDRARRGRPVPLYDVVGDGPAREAFARQAAEEGVADRVRFHGRLPRSATLRLVAGARAFVVPSAPEAWGVAYLEAMALGVPPVAVRGEGPSAFVTSGEDGLLVERTAEAVGAAVDGLLDEPAFRDRLAAAAVRRSREHGWTRAARAFLDALPPSSPPSRPVERRPWLALYNEPTPYVTGKLDVVEASGSVRLRRAWAGVDGSQDWAQDGGFRPDDVLDGARSATRVAVDLLRGRFAGLHAGGWSGPGATRWLLAAAWFGRRPLVLESDTHVSRARGTRAVLRRAYLRWLDRRVRTWLPGGSPQAEHLARTVAPRAPVRVEGMTTDTTTLLEEAATRGPLAAARWRAERGIPPEGPLALYVGRVAPEKGVPDLLEAVAVLAREGLDLHVALVGPGADAGAIRADGVPAGRLHASGRSRWRDLVPAYSAADVLVLPSRFEPWGLVVNEALLLGCPVVVTDAVGAARDLVAGPGSGLVVPAGDPRALAAAIRTVLEAGGRASEYARRGRTVARAWSREQAARAVVDAMTGARVERRRVPC